MESKHAQSEKLLKDVGVFQRAVNEMRGFSDEPLRLSPQSLLGKLAARLGKRKLTYLSGEDVAIVLSSDGRNVDVSTFVQDLPSFGTALHLPSFDARLESADGSWRSRRARLGDFMTFRDVPDAELHMRVLPHLSMVDESEQVVDRHVPLVAKARKIA